MKSTILNFISFIFLVVILGNCREDVDFDPTASRYFPLSVGNYWKLEPVNPMGMFVKIDVTDQVTIHSKVYFKLHQSVQFAKPDPGFERDFYLYTDKNNFVYSLYDSAANIEDNFLRLGAPNGYRWKTLNTTATVSTEPIEINGHVVNDCKTFYFNDPGISDDEHSETLASGVGYVRLDAGWGRMARLSEAMIDGVEFRFD